MGAFANWAALSSSIRASAETQVRDEIREFFRNNPEVAGFTWTQYTPYFNDGDTCEFSVHSPSFSVPALTGQPHDPEALEDRYSDEYNLLEFWAGGRYYLESHPEFTPEQVALVNRIAQFSSDMQGASELLRYAFGDHAKVVATPESITSTEYEHD